MIIISVFILPILVLLVFVGIIMFSGSSASTMPLGANVAVIPIVGTIMTEQSSGLFESGGASSSDIVGLIEQADEDPKIKAILFEINSPGGSPVASDEIGTAIKKTTKPTVALIRDVGASGGYWVASACDGIVANRMSVTGSIGVYSGYLEFSGLLERYNVTYERIIAGEHKDIGVPYRKLTAEETDMLLAQNERLRQIFIQEVATNRDLPYAHVERLADGMIMLGEEAYDEGLVDKLGGEDEALDMVRDLTGLDEITTVELRTTRTFLDSLAGMVAGIQPEIVVNLRQSDLRGGMLMFS